MELEQGQKRAALGQKLAGKFTRRGGCPGCPVTERDCVEQSRLHANVTPRPTAPRQRQSEPTGLSLDTAFGNGSPADGAKRKGRRLGSSTERFYWLRRFCSRPPLRRQSGVAHRKWLRLSIPKLGVGFKPLKTKTAVRAATRLTASLSKSTAGIWPGQSMTYRKWACGRPGTLGAVIVFG
jgi:hypothetical protein